MLQVAMPPKVVLENSFVGLRHAIADEIEAGMESQWKNGVRHAELLAQARIDELAAEVKLLRGKVAPTDDDLAWWLMSDDVDLDAISRELESLVSFPDAL